MSSRVALPTAPSSPPTPKPSAPSCSTGSFSKCKDLGGDSGSTPPRGAAFCSIHLPSDSSGIRQIQSLHYNFNKNGVNFNIGPVFWPRLGHFKCSSEFLFLPPAMFSLLIPTPSEDQWSIT